MAINGLEGSESWRVNHGRELARVILGEGDDDGADMWGLHVSEGREKKKKNGGVRRAGLAAARVAGPRVGLLGRVRPGRPPFYFFVQIFFPNSIFKNSFKTRSKLFQKFDKNTF